jgi:pimeloyl-ACP methyl ester carboxylesterase
VKASRTDVTGVWIRRPALDSVVIFVHGILSNGDVYWRSNKSYWPDLLSKEDLLSGIGIYVFSYRSDAFSAGYSLGDAVEALNNYLRLDKILQMKNVVFVCHSMGGIVVRQFLVTRQMALAKHGIRIGIYLVASPSLGSGYANLVCAVARVFATSQAHALRFAENNTWLNDLDRNFINLKESNSLLIEGKEIVEDQFFAFPTLFKPIVAPFSGAKYFGDSLKIPYSDHWTIAAPLDRTALQHRLLVEFISEFIGLDKLPTNQTRGIPAAAGEPRFRGQEHTFGHALKEPESLEGTEVGAYILKKFIGSGGSGIVYVARDAGLGRDVCVKVLYPIRDETKVVSGAIARGVRALASLDHPNIIKLLSFGSLHLADASSHFIAMEFVSGKTLDEWSCSLTEGSRASALRFQVALALARALHAAHTCKYFDEVGFEQRGLLHGDIKPSNVLVRPDNSPVLLDFMIVDVQRLLDPRIIPSWAGKGREPRTTAFGTPGYMAPEQEEQGIVSVRTDIYSFGVTLARLFDLRLRRFDTRFEGNPTSECSVVLQHLVTSMMAADPKDRPLDMAELIKELDRTAA